MRFFMFMTVIALLHGTYDLSGTWDLNVISEADEVTFETVLELEQDGTKLKGIWTPGVKEHASPVEGTIEDDSIIMVARPTHPRYKGSRFEFKGKVHSTDSMDGQLKTPDGVLAWEAKRIVNKEGK